MSSSAREDRYTGTAITLAIAALTWFGLKTYALQAYPVRTPSMEPTIEGDSSRGDLVLVDKTADNFRRLARFDTVVFREASGTKVLVKRVAGLPGEFLRIRDFDLWVGNEPDALRRVVKSPVEFSDLLFDYWSNTRDPRGFASKVWRRERCELGDDGQMTLDGRGVTEAKLFPPARFRKIGVHRSTAWREAWNLGWQEGSILVGYLDAFDERQASLPACIDFGVALAIADVEETCGLWIDVRHGDNSWALHYSARGRAEILANGKPLEGMKARDVPPLREARDVLFLYIDGGFVLLVDGVQQFRRDVDVRRATFELKLRKAWNGLGIAASRGRLTLRSMRVVQDLHYLDQGAYAVHEAYPIPSDAIFVLGDNSRDSRDSRHQGSIPLARTIGKPLAILGPAGRRGFLRR